MYHGISFRKLGRTSAHRLALLRNMVTSLVKHDRITTTLPKAKELRRVADQMVTVAKLSGSDLVEARRRAHAVITEREVVDRLIAEFPSRFKDRNGGYTRIVKTGFRTGDAAPMCYIEYLDRPQSTASTPPAKSA
ncbi:mitochondrial ribosomal protein L17 (bL17m) [Andalucia godoyi]|uniref:Large ribosomal subunit protein bL17c n=1 Tax=Andalucia godoyi TaxID=505711 RepID=A0A8K0F443_ANDGO|nr:mitochondrial ribosomal protein L17 (bL17m) [Andalucia godoyi]|eukprot:ANDGO_05052.mRNA.1 mitochondrial ribosomal protein L17 (bL17m)